MAGRITLAVAGALGVAALLISAVVAQDNCRGFIHSSCCCTNSCCWEISEREVDPLPGDQWRIRSTGQVIARTDFSPDGKFYRCACDYDGKKWHRHQGANTRCLFVPHQGS